MLPKADRTKLYSLISGIFINDESLSSKEKTLITITLHNGRV